MNFAKFLRTSFLMEHFLWLLLSKCLTVALQFSIFLVKISCLFDSIEKSNKKGKYPDGVQISTFFSSIILFDVKDFKNLTVVI